MIAKLIAHGKDRETSLARMRQALDEMILTGIKTNIPLHKDLILQDKTSVLKQWTSITLKTLVKASGRRKS